VVLHVAKKKKNCGLLAQKAKFGLEKKHAFFQLPISQLFQLGTV